MAAETTPAIERGGDALERWAFPPAGTDHEAAEETSTPRDAARVVLAAALDVEEMARVQTAHIRRKGDRSHPVPCACGEPWSPRHQAAALRASILGGAR